MRNFRSFKSIFNILFTIGSRGASAILGMIISIFLARSFSLSDQGMYTLFLTTCLIVVQFSNLGLNSANTFFAINDKDLKSSLIHNSFIVSIIFAIAWCFIVLVSNIFDYKIIPSRELQFFSFIFIPTELLFSYLHSLSLGLQNLKYFYSIDIIRKVLTIIFLFLSGFFVTITPEHVALIITITNLITLSALFYWFSYRPSNLKFSFNLFKKTLKYGLWIYLGTLFGFLIARFSLIFINYFQDSGQSGLYSVVLSLSDAIYLLPSSIAMALFSNFIKTNSLVDKISILKKYIFFQSIFLLFVLGIAAIYAESLIELLYGTKYTAATNAFRWMLPATFLLSNIALLQYFLASFNDTKFTIIGPLISLPVSFLLNIILIQKYGILGASISSVFSYLAWFLTVIIFIKLKVNHENNSNI